MAHRSYFFTTIGCNCLVFFSFLPQGCLNPIFPPLQLTNDAVNPATWRNRNVQVIGWVVARSFVFFVFEKNVMIIPCLTPFRICYIYRILILYDIMILCLIFYLYMSNFFISIYTHFLLLNKKISLSLFFFLSLSLVSFALQFLYRCLQYFFNLCVYFLYCCLQ